MICIRCDTPCFHVTLYHPHMHGVKHVCPRCKWTSTKWETGHLHYTMNDPVPSTEGYNSFWTTLKSVTNGK